MKDPLPKKKVVVRHLPPSLSQSDLLSEIDPRFADRYNWVSFRPGKSRFGFLFSRWVLNLEHWFSRNFG